MILRGRLYNALVNKVRGIAYRYHKFHDGTTGAMKVISWLYLLWLNFAYYCLFCKFLAKSEETAYYEQRRIPIQESESGRYSAESGLSVARFVEKLADYDIISFDIFDTLIFRPVTTPTDVFHMLEQENGVMDFSNIRAWNEWDARVKHSKRTGNYEIDLSQVWDNISEDVGLDAEVGQKLEMSIEEEICYANPFMKQVWDELVKLGKKIIIVTDMYLPLQSIEAILKKNGYTQYEKLYLSNVYQKSKADGKLYKIVRKDFPDENIIHVGDNPHSDQAMAHQAGFDVCPYQNINKYMYTYRPYDMSALVGSAYRAVISGVLYNGLNSFSNNYEYGFVYGGLFVLGYCNYIHEYVKDKNIDKVLFLSRDGDTLKQAYDYLYPGERTEYVYWSRKAATKMEAFFDKHDFFRRFIYHKLNQKYTIRDILKSMDLEFLADELSDWEKIWTLRAMKDEDDNKQLIIRKIEESDNNAEKNSLQRGLKRNFRKDVLEKRRRQHFVPLHENDELTHRNGYLLRQFIEGKWDEVLEAYSDQLDATKKYYQDVIGDSKKVAAVDIGWAGSGAMVLRHLVRHEWKMDCDLIGIIAGTNTIYNAEPDAAEAFLQSGQLVSYLYSQSHNRDLLKKHDLNRDYNIFWELLLSSPTPQFKGFYSGDVRRKHTSDSKKVGTPVYMENLDITLAFGKYDKNQEGICEIQSGILDFVKEYHSHFKKFPYMERISGRDAYAPMLVAASHKEKYLKAVEKRFDLEINVN